MLNRETEARSEALAALSGALRHRGPDDAGDMTIPVGHGHELGLVHRRLSIIDLSQAGHQPMVNPDTSDVLVFNGEIYNFLELRRELQGAGQHFASQTDTEVILKGYAVWGVDVLQRLRGMFAIALVDAKSKETLLARDHAGIKPLYYATAPRGDVPFLFASEVRAILASGLIARHLNPAAVSQFLINGFVPEPLTMIEGVRSLLPAHYMIISPTGAVVKHEAFWHPPAVERAGKMMSRAEAASAVRHMLEETIDQHVISDVPLGAFLSGGIDSSVIAALMAQRGADNVRTFSLVFDDPQLTEEQYSRAVARRLQTRHSECRISENEFIGLAEDGLAALDQPTTDGLNTYVVSRKCREAGLTVALAGTGGDELFGGYTSFQRVPRALRLLRMVSALPKPLGNLSRRAGRAVVGCRNGSLPSAGLRGKMAALLQLPPDPLSVYHLTRMVLLPSIVRDLAGDWGESSEKGALPEALAESITRRAAGHDDLLAQISVYEQMSYLTNQLLRDSDAVSMAVALEIRVPFLDLELLKTVEGLPPQIRFDPHQTKGLLIEATKDILPTEAYQRPKQGFVLPLGRWLAGGLKHRVRDLLHDSEAVARAGLDPAVTRTVLDDCLAAGQRIYFTRLWALFVLVDWCRRNNITGIHTASGSMQERSRLVEVN